MKTVTVVGRDGRSMESEYPETLLDAIVLLDRPRSLEYTPARDLALHFLKERATDNEHAFRRYIVEILDDIRRNTRKFALGQVRDTPRPAWPGKYRPYPR
jgi:hypothetical protein